MATGAITGLSRLVSSKTEEILVEWKREARALPPAQGLSDAQLVDNFPGFFEALVEQLARAEAGAVPQPPRREAMEHAMTRLEGGYDAGQVLQEWVMLREATTRALAGSGADLTLVHQAIDRGMLVSLETFSAAHASVLEALDRVSQSAFESAGLRDLLVRFVEALVERIPSIDAAAVLLREGGELVSVAAAGRAADRARHLRLPLDVPFASALAAGGGMDPVCLDDGTDSELAVWARGLRAVCGAGLREDGELAGVSLVGSQNAAALGPWERRLFGSMAARASAAIAQQRLRDDLGERAEQLAQSEARARRSVRWLEAVISGAMEGVLVATKGGAIAVANEAAARAFGVPREELLSLRIDELPGRFRLCGPDGDAVPPLGSRALDGELVPPEERTITAGDGAVRTLRTSAAPLAGTGGAVEGAVILVADLSSLKDVERERERVLADLESEHARLVRANRFRDEVLATVSHDLRNPLGAIVTSAAVLERLAPTDAASTRPLQTIQRAARRMTHLIGDLLDTASIEAGHLSVHPESLSAASLLKEAAELQEPVARERELVVEVVPPAADPAVLADRERVLQVFSNLFANAIRFSKAGGRIVAKAEPEEGFVRFAVVDDGPGISDSVRGRLFEPFVSGGVENGAGVGLGLFISKAIVEAHGGTMVVENPPGGGAAFSFTIPRVRA